MANPFESDDTFKASEILGKNYHTALTNQPTAQPATIPVNSNPFETPSQSSTAPNVKLEFHDFNLQHNATPAYNPNVSGVTGAASTNTNTASTSAANNNFMANTGPTGSGPEDQATEHFFANTESTEERPKPAGVIEAPPLDPNAKPWNLDYYRYFFNVNSKNVLHRIFKSVIPFPANFFEIIKPNPDLYGPFWIASTVVFLLAATGNIAGYFSALSNGQTEVWQFDVNKLSYAAAAIYGYLFVMPLILFGLFHYYKIPIKFIEALCLYGYSFFIYVPISVLCVIPINGLRWALVGFAGILSTVFLISNIWPGLKSQIGKGVAIIIVMALLHLGFALACQLYFFVY